MLQVAKTGSSTSRENGLNTTNPQHVWPYALTPARSQSTIFYDLNKKIVDSTRLLECSQSLSPRKDEIQLKDEVPENLSERPSNPSHDHPCQGRKGSCAVCGISCRLTCAGCKGVFYCSKKHQQVHWSKHKTDCRPFSIPPQYPSGWCTAASRNSLSPRQGIGGNSSKPTNPTSNMANKSRVDHDGGSLELKWMVANREIHGGATLLCEKPIITTPNYPIDLGASYNTCVCLGCYKQFPVFPGDLSSGDNRTPDLDVCKRCLLPLCHDCIFYSNAKDQSDKFVWFHNSDECHAIGDAVAKNRQIMAQRNEKLGQNTDLVKDFTILRLLLLHKHNFSKWDSFISLKYNPRYAISTKLPTDFVKEWTTAEYHISENYMKNIFKDKTVKLEEVVRIFAVFSDISNCNPQLRVLYELRSWIPHSCVPNVEFHFKPDDPSQTLYVKTVDTIKPDGLVSINYLENYDEGTSKAAIRLFTTSGLSCADSRCTCKTSGMDTSVGIKCNLLSGIKDTLASCPGSLCPVLDAPNTDKANLGLLIYVKSKTWNCNKCRKSEKFSTIQKLVKEITEKMKKEVEDYCNFPDSTKYSNVKQLLKKNLSDSHWLHGKVNNVTLECWHKIVGHGNEMLSKVVGLTPGDDKKNFTAILSQKIQMYGNGIFPQSSLLSRSIQSPAAAEVLANLSRKRGRLSPIRGLHLFDAFYSNFIVFVENFKDKLSEVLTNGSKLGEVITDTLRCWQTLIRLLEDASTSLNLLDTPEGKSKTVMASQMLEVFQEVYVKSCNNRSSVLQYMREFLEVYAIQDTAFIAGILSKFKPMSDEIDRYFDHEPKEYLNLTFGPASFGSSQNDTSTTKDFKKSYKDMGGNSSKTTKDTGLKDAERKGGYGKHTFPPFEIPNRYNHNLLTSSDSEDGLGGDSFGSFFNHNDEDREFEEDGLFGLPMEYYEKLLNDSVKQRMAAEEILRNMFK